MGLYERLVGEEEPKLPVHQFYAACHEVVRGQKTGSQAAVAFGLSASEQAEAQTLIARVQSTALTAEEVHQVLCLGEQRLLYASAAEVKTRLGV